MTTAAVYSCWGSTPHRRLLGTTCVFRWPRQSANGRPADSFRQLRWARSWGGSVSTRCTTDAGDLPRAPPPQVEPATAPASQKDGRATRYGMALTLGLTCGTTMRHYVQYHRQCLIYRTGICHGLRIGSAYRARLRVDVGPRPCRRASTCRGRDDHRGHQPLG